jgi:hypothetical protein
VTPATSTKIPHGLPEGSKRRNEAAAGLASGTWMMSTPSHPGAELEASL